MRTLLLLHTLLMCALASHGQNTIHTHAIGNWRNGPVVLITPVYETSEAVTRQQHRERFREWYPELKDIPENDLDVLLFATVEEAEESRRSLRGKYAQRKLEVRMLPHVGDPTED